MRLIKEIIAKKYAKALLNNYFTEIRQECFDSLLRLQDFLKKHRKFVCYLAIPSVSDSLKEALLEEVLKMLTVCSTIKKLIVPLLEHRRISLLDQIIAQLIEEYRCRVKEMLFDVTTSHNLSEARKQSIIDFLAIKTGWKIVPRFSVDKRLLCGFRAQSATFLYERSIMKTLRDTKISFYQRIKL